MLLRRRAAGCHPLCLHFRLAGKTSFWWCRQRRTCSAELNILAAHGPNQHQQRCHQNSIYQLPQTTSLIATALYRPALYSMHYALSYLSMLLLGEMQYRRSKSEYPKLGRCSQCGRKRGGELTAVCAALTAMTSSAQTIVLPQLAAGSPRGSLICQGHWGHTQGLIGLKSRSLDPGGDLPSPSPCPPANPNTDLHVH